MVDVELLREQQFFSDLDNDELKVIAEITNKKSFAQGDTIFRDGEDGESIYIIQKGEVKACREASDGELFTLTLLKDGEIFGEMSFLDGRPHSATMVALTEVESYIINRNDFEKIVDEHPRVIFKVMRNIIFTIHSVVRGMNSRYIEMVNYMWGRKRFT